MNLDKPNRSVMTKERETKKKKCFNRRSLRDINSILSQFAFEQDNSRTIFKQENRILF